MKKYDIFPSQNGYAVALGVYNDSPVMGKCCWLETEELAKQFASHYKIYREDLEKWEEKCMNMMPCNEEDLPLRPNRWNYKIPKARIF